MKTKLIVVLGPTAVGKTALGIELAKRYDGEIVSGDSQQVYRGLDIGTAKATAAEQAAAPHHLIDIREVTQGYSAYDFVVDATQAIQDISSRGKLPIIVGGTGLYIQSLLEGYHLGGSLEQEQLLTYRSQLEELSLFDLQQMANVQNLQVDLNNRRRLIRVLELARFGGSSENAVTPFQPLLLGLTDQRPLLYERINQRVDLMLEAGLLEEVTWLYHYHPQSQAALGIGYKEFFPYLEGKCDLKEAVDKVKQQSRRFAKRQLTWFRNRMQVEFYQRSQEGVLEELFAAVEEFIND